VIPELATHVDRLIANPDATPVELDELAQTLFDLAYHLENAAQWRRRFDQYRVGAS